MQPRPEEVTDALDVPPSWRLVAYLCVGYPAEEHADPELVRERSPRLRERPRSFYRTYWYVRECEECSPGLRPAHLSAREADGALLER
jgi:hypothetical protein